MKTKHKLVSLVLSGVLFAGMAFASTPAQFGLKEGNLIRATGDNDVFIVNEYGYKRLFLNPAIFNMYGHLGGWSNVKTVSPATRDAFITSPYFRADGDTKVYKLEQTGDDTGMLRWVNTSQSEFLANANINQIFTINSSESNWYPKGADFTFVAVSEDKAVLAVDNTKSQTITKNATGFTLLKVDFKGSGSVEQLKVKRLGFGSSDDYSGDGVYLYANGKRLADVRSFNSDSLATFNNLHLKAPFTLEVKADFAGSVGNVAKVQLVGEYKGLPLDSNSFVFAGASSGKLEVFKVGSLDSVVVGQKGAQVSEFKANASADESVTLKHIELFNGGDAELSNPYLKVDDVKYVGYVSGDYLVFELNLFVKEGKSKTVEVYADVNGDSGDTVKLYVENSYDLLAVGGVYDFGVVVDSLAFDTATESHSLALVSNGSLVAELDNSLDPQAVVWGDNGKLILGFTLESDEESFKVNEVKVEVDSSVVSKVYLYAGNNLLKTMSVNDEDAVSFENLSAVVNGVVAFSVKADFVNEADVVSSSFASKLTKVVATGVGSDEEVNLSLALVGENVYVYPSVPKLVRTDSFGTSSTLISGVEQEVLSWSLTAVGGDVRLASTSNAFTFSVVDSGLASPSTDYAFRVVSGGNDVASGSIVYTGNTLVVSFEDDVVVQEGQTKEFTLYADFLNFASSGTRYFRAELKDNSGAVKWQSKDKEGEWSADLSSVIDTLNTLPLKFSQFANSN